MSNVIGIGDDTPFTISGPDGDVSFVDRDFFTFYLGFTEEENFLPSILTETFGEIFINGISGTVFSKPDTDFWNGTALPTSLDFFDSEVFDSSLFGFSFIGDELIDEFELTGQAVLTDTNGDSAVAVSEPSPLALFFAGFALLCLMRTTRTAE